jgi:hypothetical protein
MYTGAQWNGVPIKIIGDHCHKGRDAVIVDHHEETAAEQEERAVRRLYGKKGKGQSIEGLPKKQKRRAIVFTVRLEGDNNQFLVEEICAVHR